MSRCKIFEVGARDGLQNESRQVSYAVKAWFVESLASVGLKEIEVGAFVRKDRVPQMADTDKLYRALKNGKIDMGRAKAWGLIANEVGLNRALSVGAKNLAVFTAASETFNQKNIGMSVSESLKKFKPLVTQARAHRVKVRGYVSTVFGCPFDGRVTPSRPLRVAEKLLEMGVEQVSFGDTIGVATPRDVEKVIRPALRRFGTGKVAVHFHDTRGTALANSLKSLELGVETFDSSAGGLGGCPFAPGATGNVATEDLIFLLHGMGVKTGVDLDALCEVSLKMARKMKRPLTSRYLAAYESSRKRRS